MKIINSIIDRKLKFYLTFITISLLVNFSLSQDSIRTESVNENNSNTNTNQFNIKPKLATNPTQPILEKPTFYKTEVKNKSLGEPTQKRYSTPVKIQNYGNFHEDGYESPTFIHKNEKVNPPTPPHSTLPSTNPANLNNIQSHSKINAREVIQKDMTTFIRQLENSKDKEERIQVLHQGKVRLDEEAKLLAGQIEEHLKELLYAKE